ncbi:unnamed protein product [marine sediment metagenome]|uniref:Uncharacterized protein n=1 Tax=marine sediment metagenome TaxID=412755 RepID=X0YRF2_9ZZZZ
MSDIYARRVDWAEKPEKIIAGMAAEPKEAKNIQVEALKDEKVIAAIRENLKEGGAWTKEHLSQMGKRGDLAEQIKNKVVIPHKKEFSPQVQMWLDSNAAKSTYGTKEELEEMLRKKREKTEEKTTPTPKTEGFRKKRERRQEEFKKILKGE